MLYATCDLVEIFSKFIQFIVTTWILLNYSIGKKKLRQNPSVDEFAAKKQHKQAQNDPMELDNDVVFALNLESPECVKLLFNCL